MARFSRADATREWSSYAVERRFKHHSEIAQIRRARLRKALKKAREQSGFDQRQAAELLGQDQSFISKIESGKRQVEFVEVEEFAQIYDKPLWFFSSAVQNATKRSKTKLKKIDGKKRRVR